MHNIKLIVENSESVKLNLATRGFNTQIIDQVLQLNQSRKEKTAEVERIRAEVNSKSREVGMLKKSGKEQESLQLVQEVHTLKEEMERLDAALIEVEREQNDLLSVIPNLISDQTPRGKSEADNVIRDVVGKIPQFSFVPKDHVELGETLGMLSFDQAALMTGSRFVVYYQELAMMERALINFMLDSHRKAGYTEVLTPLMVNGDALYGTGQLPKFKDDLFKIEGRDWYLIPTSEVPLVNTVREKMLSKSELPLRLCAYSPCFRSEAGSYGKDTRGLIRLHQFNKVELVNIVEPEFSEDAHREMVLRARSILDDLELAYRTVDLCSADIGFGAVRTIDIEVWLPAQNCYREISSVSNCDAFQARRADIRYKKDAKSKPEFLHTLNGSGLAVGRTLVAILENYQQQDGSIVVPEILRNYMGGLSLIKR